MTWTKADLSPYETAGFDEYWRACDRFFASTGGISKPWTGLTDEQRQLWCETAARRTNPEVP